MAITYLHTNNASSNLAASITAAVTTIRVQTGHGTLFPNPGVDQGFFVTVEDRRLGKLEIMLCTARSADTLTVTRGQQGTVPQSFNAGVNVSNRVTAQILNEFVAATVATLPIARLPQIPDANLTTVNANRLFGAISATLLPDIPASKLTSVPAASLTGTIAAARLPNPLPAANLPEIPATKLTSVPAASLTGTISGDRLPAIPAAKLTSVPAASLTGTIASERLSAAMYDNLVAVKGTGNAWFDRFIGNTTGGASAPTFTWSGYGNNGIWFNPPSNEMVFTIGGVNRFKVGPTAVIAYNGADFRGDGGGLTNIQSAALPQPGNTTERTRIAKLTSEMGTGTEGTYAMLAYTAAGAVGNGVVVDGANLVYASASDKNIGVHPTGTWKCMGQITNNRGTAGDITTLFMRVS